MSKEITDLVEKFGLKIKEPTFSEIEIKFDGENFIGLISTKEKKMYIGTEGALYNYLNHEEKFKEIQSFLSKFRRLGYRIYQTLGYNGVKLNDF